MKLANPFFTLSPLLFLLSSTASPAPEPRWPSFFEAPDFHLNIAKKDVLEPAGAWLEQAGKDAGRGLEAWAAEAHANLREDPEGTLLGAGLDAAKVALMFVPGLVWGPVVGVLGFAGAGVGAGTVAAAAQSQMGGAVAKGSSFAVLQSAGARGCGAAALDMLVRGGVVAWSGVEALVKKASRDGDE
ncbi:hypothetical protein F4775DRAFT_590836 [Biscogniauxia sp. FL1348]|nr:hypothetical protein F4775DRAFT_590836 [Biscogniauxia sp. FL1348]